MCGRPTAARCAAPARPARGTALVVRQALLEGCWTWLGVGVSLAAGLWALLHWRPPPASHCLQPIERCPHLVNVVSPSFTCAPCRAERSSGSFWSGFIVGGVVCGALGFVFAPQVRWMAAAEQRGSSGAAACTVKACDLQASQLAA